MKNSKIFLVKLPIFYRIILFKFPNGCLLYPGSQKEIINYESNYYSLTHNFLSELGSLRTKRTRLTPQLTKRKIPHQCYYLMVA